MTFRTGAVSIAEYGGAGKRLPMSMAAFSIAAISLVGLPPTAGFFSKWYLLVAALEEGLWPFALALVVSSLVSAVYLFRVVQRAWFWRASDGEEVAGGFTLRELPASMMAPIVLLAAAVLLLGVFNQEVATRVIAFTLPVSGPR